MAALSRTLWRRGIRSLCLAGALACSSGAQAEWSHSIDFLGLSPGMLSFQDILSENIGAALDLWTQHLVGSASVEIEVVMTDAIPRAAGHSVTSGWIDHVGTFDVYEQGLAYEIRTGADPNGALPDVRILLSSTYLEQELWLDPEPTLRSAPVPLERVDAVSLFAHEVGHALAFNGWGNDSGSPSWIAYASTWDICTTYDGAGLSFVGPASMQLYGGPIPVTLGNNGHIGRDSGAAFDLRGDLMNGVMLAHGQRYTVSALDLAMLADMRMVLSPAPEPQAIWSALAGLVLLAGLRRGLKR